MAHSFPPFSAPTDKELLAQRAYLPIFRDRRPELYGPMIQPR